jgi:hypothetical protein
MKLLKISIFNKCIQRLYNQKIRISVSDHVAYANNYRWAHWSRRHLRWSSDLSVRLFHNCLQLFNNFLLIIREYFVKAQYTGNEQLFGRTAIVTGANTGIGKEVTHDLARRGMNKSCKSSLNKLPI